MSVELHRSLMAEATKRGTTVNSLINTVLEEYAEYDHLVASHGIIRIGPSLLTGLLNTIPDKTVEEIGRKIGTVRPAAILTSIGLDFTFENGKRLVTEYIERHHRWYESRLTERNGNLTIHLVHRFNEKWSLMLRGYMTGLFEQFGFRVADSTISPYSVTIHFVKEK